MLLALLAVLSTFAFGGLLLIVVLGARRIEDELAARTAAERARDAETAGVARFFLLTPPPSPPLPRVDEALLAQLQRYLEVEQKLADQFVLQPSIETLYRQSDRRLRTH